ncbi:hypothetical protein FDP41_008738 [Naegleria fowleri]|uniref:A20-type domain-containing protein n=1 Tax=Naegleria fowleri TaxID=5763 RepID=A0A6A5BGB1_NAEFO|nr:uncharacterized protein FDP41_008738 [Naegleria fowleri]KAF0973074.1 hypothetical protein FDP41_008738 [Naegleria fowleri]
MSSHEDGEIHQENKTEEGGASDRSFSTLPSEVEPPTKKMKDEESSSTEETSSTTDTNSSSTSSAMPTKCKASTCPFFGNPKTEGYCSVCYKQIVLKQTISIPTTAPQRDSRREKDPFQEAIQKGDLERVKTMILEDKRSVNEEFFVYGDEDLGPWTPLGIACFCGHTDIVLFLLSQPGIDVNKRMYGDTYPINSCMQNHRIETAKKFIEECKKRNMFLDLHKKGYLRCTPLEMCCYEAICKNNAQEQESFVEMVLYLVKEGAEPIIDSHHFSANMMIEILDRALQLL